MKQVRALAATGMLGSGFSESSLERGLKMAPDFIGCDAGSTDGGPYYLGSGTSYFSDAAVGRDIRLTLRGGRKNGIPVIVGSAGFAGADVHVDHLVELVRRIAFEEGLHFKLGIIHSEQKADYLIQQLQRGRITPLTKTPEPLTEEVIKRSIHIVGMAGTEPFIEALDQGAEVIVAGRSSDTSIFAAIPIMRGMNPASAWHAAKILECGAACVKQRKYPDCLFAAIYDDHFIIEPPNPEYVCTPISVASHNLYENDSPYTLREPAGVLHTDTCRYEAVSDRAVRVTVGEFEAASEHTFKIEGVELAGYLSLFFGAVRDPMILKQLNSWLEGLKETLHRRFFEIYGSGVSERYHLNLRVYGLNGAMGQLEPEKTVGHEIGLVVEILADEQELATNLAKSGTHIAVHYPIPEWSGLITSLAYPYSPPELTRGTVYRFNMNHIVRPDSYKDMFRVHYESI
ncbi:MAG: acyclic terpene utilization AtuA family protein [Deltaproteobacteria bacterium]|nr:acyclic terpene utilization AtuA family protein [Deltaproteobacteria bacterium]MBW2308905.1 acyclic terpene utilization AtuA family protein [Deltaproteobacteria bacterium]